MAVESSWSLALHFYLSMWLPWALSHAGMHSTNGNGVSTFFSKRAGDQFKITTYAKMLGTLGLDLFGRTVSITTDTALTMFSTWQQIDASLLRRFAHGHWLVGDGAQQLPPGVEAKVKHALAPFCKVMELVAGSKCKVLRSTILVESGLRRSPKERPSTKVNAVAKNATVRSLEAQPKRGRKKSVRNRDIVKGLKGSKIVDGASRAAIIRSVVRADNVDIVHDADLFFWCYDDEAAADVQICLTGTATQRGDYDAVFQCAVADESRTRLVCITRASNNGEMEVVDACKVRRSIIARLLPLVSRDSNRMDFSRPFSKADQRLWLGSMFVTSCHGAQDYVPAVIVKRPGIADKQV